MHPATKVGWGTIDVKNSRMDVVVVRGRSVIAVCLIQIISGDSLA
jgi:hypothetical protein